MGNPIDRLRTLDAAWAGSTLSPAADRHIRERMASELDTRPGRVGAPIVVAGACLALLFAWLVWPPPTTNPSTLPSMDEGPSRQASWQPIVPDAECAPRVDGSRLELSASCRFSFEDLAVRVSALDSTVLETTPDGLRMRSGRAIFDVAPRAEGRPFSVEVSRGRIDVLGTRFTVSQDEDGGSVVLLEGTIAFVRPDGSAAVLRPTERLGWDVDADVPAQAAQDQRRPPPPAPREPVQLEAAQAEPGPPPKVEPNAEDDTSDEELSYELGLFLDGRGDQVKACRHWRHHVRRFFEGPYYKMAWKRFKAACESE
jgi:hypothetical protein